MLQFEENRTEKQSLNDLLSDPSINNIMDSCLDDVLEDLYAVEEISIPVPNRDGEVRFQISCDNMTVMANFYPSSGTGENLTESGVLTDLLDMGILQTLVDLEEISSGLHACNEIGVASENHVIARGIDPEPCIPDHINLYINPLQYVKAVNELILKKKEQRVDYKDFSQLCILEQGTPVGQWIGEKPGITGMDVLGSAIQYQTVKTDEISIGKNLCRQADGEIVTTIDGEFVFEDGEIFVNEVLTLNNGINYKTGHIRFPGTIIINGEVEDDFNIKAAKNIYISNSLAASDINCGGSLVVTNGGIIGRKRHKVMVKDFVEAVHTKTAHIEAEKGIYITKGSLDSKLFTNGEIIFGSNGRLIGGEVYAKEGVHTHIIGSESSTPTQICCGIDYKDIQTLFTLKKYRLELSEAKDKSRNQLDDDTYAKLEKQLLKCELSLEQILGRMQYNENAQIVVLGTIYPGTTLNICHIKKTVTEEVHNVTFYLDKKIGEICFRKNIS